MRTQKSGDEPLSARSPLHLRLILAGFGALFLMVGAVYAFTRTDPAPGVVFLGGISAVFAIIALVDISVITARLRHHDTPHFGLRNHS